MRKKIIVVGDSHVHAVQRAITKVEANGIEWSAFRLKRAKANATIEGVSLDDLPTVLASSDLVLTAIAGSYHATLALMLGKMPFDFAAEQPDYPIIPMVQMREIFDAELEPTVRPQLEAIVSAAPCRVIQLLTPPPKADEAFMRQHIKQFAAFADALDPRYRPIRLKLWKIHNERVEVICKSLGVGVLPPPRTHR